MIGVSEGKDMEARAFLELAGIDSSKYRIEKATLEVVKSPGALAEHPGHKNNNTDSL